MGYTEKQFKSDLKQLEDLISKYEMKGGKMKADTRTFRVVEVDGKHVNTDKGGRYRITDKQTPEDAAKKAYTQLYRKHKKNGKIKFMIKETTRGSAHKVFGPYVGHRKKLAKPRMVSFAGKKPIKLQHIPEVHLNKNHKGGHVYYS